ncbi:MAG: VCBS repeat-containing protein, partial [Candidatus Latescibacterota bacterium]|nr:VCBS repeat-containing protein [Candidatus Latescibacterota bacterium]
MDIFTTHFEGEYNTLYRNEGNGSFADISAETSLVKPSQVHVGFGTGFFDADNDGDLDLYTVRGEGESNSLYLNTGGRFDEVAAGVEGAASSTGAAWADFDNDGDLDIAIHNLDSTPSLLRNDTQNNN